MGVQRVKNGYALEYGTIVGGGRYIILYAGVGGGRGG